MKRLMEFHHIWLWTCSSSPRHAYVAKWENCQLSISLSRIFCHMVYQSLSYLRVTSSDGVNHNCLNRVGILLVANQNNATILLWKHFVCLNFPGRRAISDVRIHSDQIAEERRAKMRLSLLLIVCVASVSITLSNGLVLVLDMHPWWSDLGQGTWIWPMGAPKVDIGSLQITWRWFGMKKGDFGGVLKKATIMARRFLQCPDMVRTCYRS